MITLGCLFVFLFYEKLGRRTLQDVQGCTFERRTGSDGKVKALGSLFRVEEAKEWAQVYAERCVRLFFKDGRSLKQCYPDETKMLSHLHWFCTRATFEV